MYNTGFHYNLPVEIREVATIHRLEYASGVDYLDFMVWKLGIMAVLAFIYGFLIGVGQINTKLLTGQKAMRAGKKQARIRDK